MKNRGRKKLEERRRKIRDFDGFRVELDAGNDRVTAILWGARLEALLDELLRKACIGEENDVDALLEPEGPLGSFSAKIRALYCFGILSKSEFRNLVRIKNIRNLFAHELHGLSFETPKIAEICSNLEIEGTTPHDSRPENLFLLTVILFDVGLPLRLMLIPTPTIRPERTWEDDMEEVSRTGDWVDD